MVRRIGRCTLLFVVLVLCLAWTRSYYYYDGFELSLDGHPQEAELALRSGRGYIQAYVSRNGDSDDVSGPTTLPTWLGIWQARESITHEWESGCYAESKDPSRRPKMEFENYRMSICGKGAHVMHATVPYWLPGGLVGLPMVGMAMWGSWTASRPKRGFGILQAA